MKTIYGEEIGTTIDFRTIGPYETTHPWPQDTLVRAGKGVVIVRGTNGQNYQTLFMECYPPEGGFLRGEGEDPKACEDDAWNKYQLMIYCTDRSAGHTPQPRGRTDGAGFCSKCNTFIPDAGFTGQQLGQFCYVCKEPTTHQVKLDAQGRKTCYCEAHAIQEPSFWGSL